MLLTAGPVYVGTAVFQSYRNVIKFIFEKVTLYSNNCILGNFSTVYLCHY